MSRSFQLIRTNPKLTTNIKLIVDTKYNLYFESFDSNKELSDQKYKNYLLNDNALLENEIPKFYDKLPKNLAFYNKNNDDVDVMYKDYKHQFDNIYYSGANEIDDNSYNEEFEYFAPLYIKKNEFPSNFIILRVDDAAIYENNDGDYSISSLNSENFRNEIINKWKCVNVFDLSNNTNVGKFFDRNINNNDRFPLYTLFFDTKKYNYSKWSGLEYKTGIYKTAEMLIDDKVYYSNPHYKFEDFITNGFEKNGLIYPNILNIKFLFDDNPATPEEYKKWTMNRYFGFYIDQMYLVKSITSYKLPELKDNLEIKNNIFLLNGDYVNPYTLESSNDKWIQVDNEFYKVKKQSNGSFKIISDKNLTGYDVSTFNKGQCEINYENGINKIDIDLSIDNYINEIGNEYDMYADLYLIRIDNMYHVLRKNENGYFIDTDYAIISNKDSLTYWKGGQDSADYVQKIISKNNNKPLIYNIYRVKFLDIKDFDYDRINTKYSDFDYEKSEYYDTPEIKLYAKEYRDNSNPTRYKTHDEGEDGQYKVKNISSEYTAGDETFELNNNKLTPLFQKNQYICKWSYVDSISHSDYPYKLNNNYEIGGTYNRTTNPNLNVSSVEEKTLDYFYRIGEFYGNSNTYLYKGFDSDFQTLWNGDTSVDGGNVWDYLTSTDRMLVDASSGLHELEFNQELEVGQLYHIYIDFSDISNTGSGYEIGIDSNSFLNGTSTSTNDTVINLYGYALSSTFKIFVNRADLYINFISINKLEDKYYLNQSTNIQTKLLSKFDENISTKKFNLQYYLDSNFDYFDYFFNNIMYYNENGILKRKQYKKYSIFNGGDDNLPSSTLFKGIEYKLYSVTDIVLNPPKGVDETIRKIITDGGEEYNGYKFSVILSESYDYYDFDFDGNDYTNPVKLNNVNNSIYGTNRLNNPDKNGLHVILNEKYKNILIIINKIIPINVKWLSLNNIDLFGENHGLYFGKTKDDKYNLFPLSGTSVNEYNPNDLTAYFYIDSLNNLNVKGAYDNYVSYYMINKDGLLSSTEMVRFNDSTFSNIDTWNKKFPLFYIDVDVPSDIELKKRSYNVYPIKGPNTNIYDKYLIYSNNVPLPGSIIDEPLSRLIKLNDKDYTDNKVNHGEKVYKSVIIDRFNGYYDPIFKDILLFKPKYYWYNIENDQYNYIDNNYIFYDNTDKFGIIDEIMYSKINEDDNYLKLKDTDNERSYYPMVDEIGLSQTSRFIFLSPWDEEFYLKTLNEQTLLENYIEIPEQIIETETLAQVLDIESELTEQHGDGVKIYGNGIDSSTLEITAKIKNLSESPKIIKTGIKFQSNNGTTGILQYVNTILLQPNEIGIVVFNVSRPNEIKNSQTPEEYTLHNVIVSCFNENDDEIHSLTRVKFNVYNDIINFNLSNPTVEYGWTTPHLISNPIDFTITSTETYNKLTNIYVNLTLYVENDTGGWNYERNSEYYTDGTDVLQINNHNLDQNALGIDDDEIVDRSVRFRIYHEYQIEDTFYVIEDYYIQSSPKLKLESPQEDPDLQWYTIPNISVDCGNCLLIGDQFTAENIKIKNFGGLYDGSITLQITLMKEEFVGSGNFIHWLDVVKTYNNIQINKNEIHTISSVDLPNTYDYGGNTYPIISRTNINYKINVEIFSGLITPNDINTETINGCCTIKTLPTCLDENSKILMYNGEEKKLKDLMYYEKVLSYKIENNLVDQVKWKGNIKNGEFTYSRVKNIIKRKVKGYNVINNGIIKATPEHIMMVYDKSNNIWKWMSIRNIRVGDKLFDNNGNIVDVFSNIYLDAYINIVGIDVEEVDNYFVNGVLHHNIDDKLLTR